MCSHAVQQTVMTFMDLTAVLKIDRQHTHTEKNTDRQTDRHPDRETDRQTVSQTDTEIQTQYLPSKSTSES